MRAPVPRRSWRPPSRSRPPQSCSTAPEPRLLRTGNGKAAQALLTARIGTVNAVCGSLVTDFSFELGLSPELRVLDEAGAELELKRALASVVTDEISEKLQSFRSKFDMNFEWHYEVRRLIEAARANGIDADNLTASCERSIASLDACLGPLADTSERLDTDLRAAIDGALAAIPVAGDETDKTMDYKYLLSSSRRDLDRGRLRWGDWAKFLKEAPGKKSLAHAGPVKAAAARHIGHPRLREELHDLIRLMFTVAASGLNAYQRLKHEQGLLDFVDQEVWALELLSRPDDPGSSERRPRSRPGGRVPGHQPAPARHLPQAGRAGPPVGVGRRSQAGHLRVSRHRPGADGRRHRVPGQSVPAIPDLVTAAVDAVDQPVPGRNALPLVPQPAGPGRAHERDLRPRLLAAPGHAGGPRALSNPTAPSRPPSGPP